MTGTPFDSGAYRVGVFVVTPSGRLAQVVGFVGERLNLRYNDRTEVLLLPELCRRADDRLAQFNPAA